ncbi:MAG: hypothetical protein PHU12_03520 [Candidatus Aenigmarchaeota archaeon]|nr:hypothetical protein [Candidatus Aenigmarchaeota archaeon]
MSDFNKLKTMPLPKKYVASFNGPGSGMYYKQNKRSTNPFLNAPIEEAEGGVIYFGNDVKRKDLMSVLNVLDVGNTNDSDKYAVYLHDATVPLEEGYLQQMRIVNRFGLQFAMDEIDDNEYENYPSQPMDVKDAFWAFMEKEKKKWGTHFWDDKKKGLAGKFGGNGDCAREELSFGLMVESGYHEIYRIWSRAWLVTK